MEVIGGDHDTKRSTQAPIITQSCCRSCSAVDLYQFRPHGVESGVVGQVRKHTDRRHRIHVDLANTVGSLDESAERLLLTEANLVGRTGLFSRAIVVDVARHPHALNLTQQVVQLAHGLLLTLTTDRISKPATRGLS